MSSELATAVENFLDYLRVVKQQSPNTQKAYRQDLGRLVEWCEKHQLENPLDIQHAHIRRQVAELHQKGLAGRSLQRWLSATRRFFTWYSAETHCNHNPADGIQAPKSAKKLPKTLDVDAIGRYLEKSDDSWLAVRDRAMVELFYSSGLRLSELATLDMPELDLKQQLVTVTGKGNKTRSLPIGKMALEALQDWLAQRALALKAGEQAVFISTRGTRISPRSIQQRLKLLGIKQGIDQPVHPHMLRHSFASHLLQSSGDLRSVQELLGHADISTTQMYTHLDFQHLASVYDKAHPRANRLTDKDKQ